MRSDQLERLNDLAERLADVFLTEADPDSWPGAGTPMEAWDQRVRGDRVWVKKGAMATAGVLRYALDLVAKNAPSEGDQPTDHAKESDLDRQIRDAEKRAGEAVARVMDKARKAEFDKRVHGD